MLKERINTYKTKLDSSKETNHLGEILDPKVTIEKLNSIVCKVDGDKLQKYLNENNNCFSPEEQSGSVSEDLEQTYIIEGSRFKTSPLIDTEANIKFKKHQFLSGLFVIGANRFKLENNKYFQFENTSGLPFISVDGVRELIIDNDTIENSNRSKDTIFDVFLSADTVIIKDSSILTELGEIYIKANRTIIDNSTLAARKITIDSNELIHIDEDSKVQTDLFETYSKLQEFMCGIEGIDATNKEFGKDLYDVRFDRKPKTHIKK